jgi:aspartate kinase
VASGEVVSASLLALALNRLGVRAVSLDAREAGIESRGSFGEAHIKQVAARKLERLLAQDVVPIVTGFQGWQRGRVATLGRGGTDTSAVAITLALGGSHTVFVKEAHGLRTADPKLVPDAERIALAPHAFLSALTAAGAKVVQAEAAALAEQHALRLEFWSLDSDGPDSVVEDGASAEWLRAVATEGGRVTALAGQAWQLAREGESLRTALNDLGITVREIQPAANGLRFVVPEHRAVEATRALHAALVSCRPKNTALRAS